jgi:hypothetical protein
MIAFVIDVRRHNRAVREHRALWDGRSYACPHCGGTMAQGWVQVSHGISWSARRRGRPAGLTAPGSTLPNTQSVHLRTASNMGWHCPKCRLLLVDHAKMVN